MEIVKTLREIKSGECRELRAVSREDLDSIRTTVSRVNNSLKQCKCDGRVTTLTTEAVANADYTYTVTICRYPGRLRKKGRHFILPTHPLAD